MMAAVVYRPVYECTTDLPEAFGHDEEVTVPYELWGGRTIRVPVSWREVELDGFEAVVGLRYLDELDWDGAAPFVQVIEVDGYEDFFGANDPRVRVLNEDVRSVRCLTRAEALALEAETA
jgi:hypothetical protein